METQNKDLEIIKEKIAKLLRKSDSAKEINSMSEATAFANKATDLLMQYNLKLHEINLEAGLPQDPEVIIFETYLSDFYNIKTTDGISWPSDLSNVIAKFNLCRLVIRKYPDGDVLLRIIGTLENAKNVISLIETMIPAARNICGKAWMNYNGSIKRNKFRRDFLNGFVNGLHLSYREQQQFKVEYGALIRVNEVAIQNFMTTSMGAIKPGRAKKINNNDAFHHGVKAGKEFNVNKEIS